MKIFQILTLFYLAYLNLTSASDEDGSVSHTLNDTSATERANLRGLGGSTYSGYDGYACRKDDYGDQGEDGYDYSVYEYDYNTCAQTCSYYSWCKGYEYSEYNGEFRCELWKAYYGYYGEKYGFSCYWKN